MKILILLLAVISQPALARVADLFPDDPEWTNCAQPFDTWQEQENAQNRPNANIVSDPTTNIVNGTSYIGYTITNLAGYAEDGSFVGGLGRGGCRATYKQVPSSLQKIKSLDTISDTIACGSVIDYQKRIVAEYIPVDGTALNLVYSSLYNSALPNNNKISVDIDLSEYNAPLLFKYNLVNSTPETAQPMLLGNSKYRLFFQSTNGSGISYSDEFLSKLEVNFAAFRQSTGGGRGYYYDARIGEFVVLSSAPTLVEVFNKSIKKAIFKPQVWGLNGWTIDQLHYFDKDSKTLFTGDGRILEQSSVKTINDAQLGNVNVIINRDNGQQIFIFDQLGRHIETRHATMGYKIFQFSYNANNSISKIIDQAGKETNFNYDNNNKISKITSPYGLETFIETENNTTKSVTNSLDKKYEMIYGDYNLLINFKNVNAIETSFSYNTDGEFIHESKNVGLTQSFEELIENGISKFKYMVANISAEIVSVTSSLNNQITTKTDQKNRQIYRKLAYFNSYAQQIDSEKFSNTTTYSPDSFWGDDLYIAQSTNFNFYDYDENNSNFTAYNSLSETRDYANSNALMPTTTQIYTGDASGTVSTVIINNTAKTITATDSIGKVSLITYNERGFPTQVSQAGSLPQDLTYNANYQLIKSEKGSYFENYSYDLKGNLASITNSKNQTTQFIRDNQGKVLTQILPNSDQIKYEYTNGGEVKKITAPNSQIHTFQLSLGDYLENYFTPNNRQTIYNYDSNKRLSTITKPSGKSITYQYEQDTGFIENLQTSEGNYQFSNIDQYGRPGNITSPDNIRLNVNWVQNQIQRQTWYDNDGSELATISKSYFTDQFKVKDIKVNNQIVASYTYQKDYIQSINNAQYSYDSQANNLSVAFNNLYIQYNNTEDTSGSVRTVKATAKAGVNSQVFITLNRIFDGSGTASDYSTLTVNTPDNTLNSYYQLTPQYDANNRLIQIQKKRKNFVNGQEVSSTDFYNHYSYPLASNNNMKEFKQSVTENEEAQKRTVASHDTEDRLISLRGSIHRDYTYSDDGDLKTMTNCYGTTTYDYDVFGNLKKVTLTDGKIIEYKVDAQNRRIKKLVNAQVKEYYLWYDQIHLAAILDENKVPKLTYIYGPESNSPSYVIKDNITYRILHDPGLGSVRYIIDPSTQQIVQDIEYDEYGNIMKNTDPDFQPLTYAGGLYDSDTKLIRFGARDYDPTIGRWTAKDPIGFAGGDTNLYAYVGGNPMSYNDPSGLKFNFANEEARQFYQPILDEIRNGSMAGQDLVTSLESSSTVYNLTLGSLPHSPSVARTWNNTIVSDPSRIRLMITTDPFNLAQTPSWARIIAHELGHLRSPKLSERDNMRLWENPVSCPIDGKTRAQY